jgi:hypothetical protein
MYFWNYHQLTHDFRANKVTIKERFKYLLMIMLYIPTGMMGANWIAGIYRLVYRIANLVLILEAPDVPPLRVFNYYDYYIDLGTFFILGAGTVICYFTYRKHKGSDFITQFMCLGVPISIRVTCYVLLIFLAALTGSMVWFFFKLQAIANIRGLLAAFSQLRRLKELMPVMALISERMYLLASGLSLLSLFWIFLLLRKELRFIVRHPKGEGDVNLFN